MAKDTVNETPIDLHDKKYAPVPIAEDGPNVKAAEENPGNGKLHVEKGEEADALPTSPTYTLNPQGQRVRELRKRLASNINAADAEVLNGEPETQYHRNQILGLRKNLIDLLSEGYGELSFEGNSVSIRVPLSDEVEGNSAGVTDESVDEEAITV